jgi:hypothetical protein
MKSHWLLLAPCLAVLGCGSTSQPACVDGGVCEDRPHLWGLSRGHSAFVVTSIKDVNDACLVNPAGMVDGPTLIVGYTPDTHIVEVGAAVGAPAMAGFGSGAVAGNLATLNRENEAMDELGCTWHQKDVSMFALFDHDKFTLAVTEERSMFAAGCPGSPVACTSTWTWTVQKKQ